MPVQKFLSTSELLALSQANGLTVKEAMLFALEREIWPERFRRQRELFSSADMRKLLSLRVFIAGCGALGGEVANLLCRMGFGAFRLCDPDVFEESNLNRQLFCNENTLGKAKAETLGQGLLDIAGYLEVEALVIAADAENLPRLLDGMDLAIDCLDSISAKKMLEDAALRLGIPCLHGSINGEEGLVSLALPGGPRLETLYPAENGERKTFNALASCCACAASIMCSLLLNFLLRGKHCDSLLHLDCSVPELETFQF